MKKEELAMQTVFNAFKVLSAIFDSNGGSIVVDKSVFENAKIGFHVRIEENGDKVTLIKADGKSELFYQAFGKDN